MCFYTEYKKGKKKSLRLNLKFMEYVAKDIKIEEQDFETLKYEEMILAVYLFSPQADLPILVPWVKVSLIVMHSVLYIN